MNTPLLARLGNRKPSDTTVEGDKSTADKPLGTTQFQFEQASNAHSESSIQRSARFHVPVLHKSQSNLTIGSQRKLIDPTQFSSQNPWNNQGQAAGIGESIRANASRLRTSASATSLSTVKRLLRKTHAPLPSIPASETESPKQIFIPEKSPEQPPHHIRPPSPDFSSAFTPTEIVICPQQRHPRVTLVTKPESPLSMGGGFLHGEVLLSVVDTKTGTHVPAVGIGCLSIDLVGVESCNRRHHVFQSLAVDLIDRSRSPPIQATPSTLLPTDGYWELRSSSVSLSFQLQLPEDPGPPPFRSRHGSIRYLLSATAIIRTGIEDSFVRDTCEIYILTPHIPRVSLVNLPQPLIATDNFVLSRGLPFQDVTLRASINRDVWSCGMSCFVDVHVRNRSLKHVNKITISLERVMMVYHHPVARVDRGVYRQSRLPDKIYRKTVASKTTSRSRIGWRGIAPHSRESRTWMLDLPPGLATISTGRYFGVRYLLKVSLHMTLSTKTLETQLPVTILDPNSLDITSEFEPLPFEGPRARPSTINSDLPPPSLRGPYGRRAEHKTPEQSQGRQRRETWAWVSGISPHPSLVPSPLLPQFGIPAKSGRTPSRLRVEDRLSKVQVPHVPERLRPPLEEQDHDLTNHGHTSDYPLDTSDTTKAHLSNDQAKHARRPLGTSTLASLQNHVQSRPRRTTIRVDKSSQDTPERNVVSADKHTRPRGDPKVMFGELDTARNSLRKSPIRKRTPAQHRRAISRTQDVHSIYRPRSRDISNDLSSKRELQITGPENGWETVENFF